jgi:UDP-N-acetylmuramate dehydrogenase
LDIPFDLKNKRYNQMKQYHNISLKSMHTFGIEAKCSQLILIEDISEIEICFGMKKPRLILGKGSNILFTRDFKGIVLRLDFKSIEKIEDNGASILLRVSAGVDWEELTNHALYHEYYGIENLTGIPGRVGSCPVQNIGAYGVEVKDVIERIEGFYIDSGEPFTFTCADCNFDYRSSIFKNELSGKCLITYVYFRLSKISQFTLDYQGLREELARRELPTTLRNITDSILKLRNSKLPDVQKIGSAGSFFKNPVIHKTQFEALQTKFPALIHYPWREDKVKLAAGQLIELCGWKGFRMGDSGVYPQQALIIVNYGNASGKEIQNLYQQIQHSVKEKFGIEIEKEVNVI